MKSRTPRTRREFITYVEAHGCSVDRAGSGHLTVRRANGSVAFTAPCTPSDYRSWLNATSQFRRALQTPARGLAA